MAHPTTLNTTALRWIALLAVALVLGLAATAAAAVTPQTSLPDIEDEVMCTVCGVPLNLATDAPQANRERAFIRSLIAQGDSKAQIKDKLAQEYGPNVLALPARSGFNLAVYLVPIGLLLAALAALAVLLPRWRRRARRESDAADRPASPELSSADAQRLAEDLARYDI